MSVAFREDFSKIDLTGRLGDPPTAGACEPWLSAVGSRQSERPRSKHWKSKVTTGTKRRDAHRDTHKYTGKCRAKEGERQIHTHILSLTHSEMDTRRECKHALRTFGGWQDEGREKRERARGSWMRRVRCSRSAVERQLTLSTHSFQLAASPSLACAVAGRKGLPFHECQWYLNRV